MLLFAKVAPYLTQVRALQHDRAFQNAEWMSKTGELADRVMARFAKMIAQRR